MAANTPHKLRKELSLFDVYVVSTAAMFSSGFFLLPGLAVTLTGPSVVLAYLLSGLLIVPAMLSQAELATAMPRAGGAYYFLDRTLGPLVGTIGGIGTWIALVLKSAFALIGMGAYIRLFVDVPLKTVAVTFTVIFSLINILGVRESTRMMRILVILLFVILTGFLVNGAWTLAAAGVVNTHRNEFTPFFTNGVDGLLETVGLVFISYIGLTKVASLAEEVREPERNIPLGMALSLGSVVMFYVAGVYLMVALVGADTLSGSVTPVADAASAFVAWVPPEVGTFLVVVAAMAAFASMSNTGILAASRYPLAMARDRLLPNQLSKIGRFHTPVLATVTTAGMLILAVTILDVGQVAKLASAVQLLLFGLINVAVIVMRESRIESYDPGFKSPLYPWMQVAGIALPLILVAEMGWLASLFSMGVVAASMGWYNYYARGRLERSGAIFHVFERLGRRRFAGLERELRDIMKEKGVRAHDPIDDIVARAPINDLLESVSLEELIEKAATNLSECTSLSAEDVVQGLQRGLQAGGVPVGHGTALIHYRAPGLDGSELVLFRCRNGADFAGSLAVDPFSAEEAERPRAVFVLVSGHKDPGQHLRILAHLAGRAEHERFMTDWLQAKDEQDLKEALLRDERFLSLVLETGSRAEELVGGALRDLRLPEGCLVALIRRRGELVVPRGGTVLELYDRLTIIGETTGLNSLRERFGD